jgi:hypothetical protein
MAYEKPEVFEVGGAEQLIRSNSIGVACDCGGKKAYSIGTFDDDLDDDFDAR